MSLPAEIWTGRSKCGAQSLHVSSIRAPKHSTKAKLSLRRTSNISTPLAPQDRPRWLQVEALTLEEDTFDAYSVVIRWTQSVIDVWRQPPNVPPLASGQVATFPLGGSRGPNVMVRAAAQRAVPLTMETLGYAMVDAVLMIIDAALAPSTRWRIPHFMVYVAAAGPNPRVPLATLSTISSAAGENGNAGDGDLLLDAAGNSTLVSRDANTAPLSHMAEGSVRRRGDSKGPDVDETIHALNLTSSELRVTFRSASTGRSLGFKSVSYAIFTTIRRFLTFPVYQPQSSVLRAGQVYESAFSREIDAKLSTLILNTGTFQRELDMSYLVMGLWTLLRECEAGWGRRQWTEFTARLWLNDLPLADFKMEYVRVAGVDGEQGVDTF